MNTIDIKSLLDALSGRAAEKDFSVFRFGAIWHGPWSNSRYLLNKQTFGNERKPCHFAVCVSPEANRNAAVLKFSPITSQKKSKALVFPSGVINTNPPRESYVIIRLKMLVKKKTLDTDQSPFEYCQCLSARYQDLLQKALSGS